MRLFSLLAQSLPLVLDIFVDKCGRVDEEFNLDFQSKLFFAGRVYERLYRSEASESAETFFFFFLLPTQTNGPVACYLCTVRLNRDVPPFIYDRRLPFRQIHMLEAAIGFGPEIRPAHTQTPTVRAKI